MHASPRYDRAWVMGFAHHKLRASKGQKPFAECLKEAWATAKEIAAGEAMRAEWARRRRLFVPEGFDPWIAAYVAGYQSGNVSRARGERHGLRN